MSSNRPASALVHPVLDEAGGRPLRSAALTDRQRVAILLQGAALLSHLEQAGWRLQGGWQGARVEDSGRLLVTPARVSAGRTRQLPQLLLRELVGVLFATGVAGRGEARRAVRRLLDAWGQTLTRLGCDEAVGEILETAPFLWEEAYGEARRALLGEHRRGGHRERWIAGPGPNRRRLFDAEKRGERLASLLESRRCREVWEGRSATEVGSPPPSALAAAGRWRAAVAAWEACLPSSSAERLALGETLYSLGRFERSLATIRRLTSLPARLLRIKSLAQLARLRPARTAIRRLEASDLDAEATLDIAPTAVRIAANSGDREGVRAWMLRALRAGQGERAGLASLVAAAAAWDLGDSAAINRYLEAAAETRHDPEVGWLWHRMQALEATAAANGVAAARHLRQALLLSRRRLRVFEVGRLWNELALARVLMDDLPAAERACRHAVRHLGRCDGPLNRILALPNLAEVRIRRGRLSGVADILERSSRENELSGNLRGAAQDSELWARFELARGEARAALERCREGLAALDRERIDWNRRELHLFAARALGWLGKGGQAAKELEATSESTRAQLEPEERPALWALANQPERATRAASGPLAELWLGVLAKRPLLPEDWRTLDSLEPYRAARLVYDFERVSPGCVPTPRLGRAIAVLRRADARALAQRLEADRTGPWQALRSYLRRPRGVPGALAELFAAAGYADVSLRWEPDEEGLEAEALVEGKGGSEVLGAPLGAGRLELTAPTLDDVLRALFSLVLREVDPPRAAGDEPGAVRGIVGKSAALRTALRRIERLAPQAVPVLVQGETGTGKELVAREIHRLSRRAGRPFVALNCAALAETLLLSDLFGHVRGAFTGADRDHAGVFEAARGGTVFLDEIGDLPLGAQGAFLRVLQEGEVRRVGESRPRRVDVRVVTATHRDLGDMVRTGRFREDLYYRLRVATLSLPPLRDRGLDMLLLAEHFLSSSQTAEGRRPRLSGEAQRRLLAHPWPGNVRELKNVLDVATAFCDGDGVIDAEHLDLPPTVSAAGSASSYHEQVEAFRRRLVQEALEQSDGNRSAAARRLGLSRQALSYLVRQLRIG